MNFKLVVHYNSRPMAVHTSPERDTIQKLAEYERKDRDVVAFFVYDRDKLIEFVFLAA